MKTLPLSTRSIDEIATIFNAVYEDYVAPVNMTADAAEKHITSNSIDLDHSPLWLDDDGSLVATSLLGVRGDRGWIGGFGVTKPYRGRGLSHQLINAVINQAADLSLREIVLEVITSNTAAIRTYQRANFTNQRDLLIFVRQPAPLDSTIDASAVTPADPATLLAHRPANAATPAWQRSPTSLTGDSTLLGLTIGPATSPTATLVYAQPSPTSIRIADIAATTPGAAQTIVTALIQQHPDATLSLVNEPEESNIILAITSLGFSEVMRQHEMLHTLGANPSRITNPEPRTP